MNARPSSIFTRLTVGMIVGSCLGVILSFILIMFKPSIQYLIFRWHDEGCIRLRDVRVRLASDWRVEDSYQGKESVTTELQKINPFHPNKELSSMSIRYYFKKIHVGEKFKLKSLQKTWGSVRIFDYQMLKQNELSNRIPEPGFAVMPDAHLFITYTKISDLDAIVSIEQLGTSATSSAP